MSKDCCAANFERSVFRNRDVLEVASKFTCVKYDMALEEIKDGAGIIERFELNGLKPAILLLDAESGLLHKQQLCVNPPEYVKIIKSAYALNGVRVKMRVRFEKKERKARGQIEKGNFGDAHRLLSQIRVNRDKLLGSVSRQVDADLSLIQKSGQELLDEARRLEEGKQLIAARSLYKKVAKEFSRFPEMKLEAGRNARRISGKLHRMGL